MVIRATGIDVVGFDADDTLWAHADHYVRAEGELGRILASFTSPTALTASLRVVEARNLPRYGFGVKGFTLSMIETAVETARDSLSYQIVAEILGVGHDLLAHPIDVLPFVKEVLEGVVGRYKLVLITKGDLLDQERKLSESGLLPLFDSIEIVSEKTEKVYTRVFGRYTSDMARAVMVGNSLRSDIIPAIRSGAWGVHVPDVAPWAMDHAEVPSNDSRFRQISDFGELPGTLEEVEALVRG